MQHNSKKEWETIMQEEMDSLFFQKKSVDFNEIFSPVVKMNPIRAILSLVAVQGLHLEQMDVKTAFLHGDLEEDIYMHQPQGYEAKGKKKMICRLKKSLYGLKQAPRQWYLKFDRFMLDHGFTRCNSDHCVYTKNLGDGKSIILMLYDDDMLIASANMQDIKELKGELTKSFLMKDLGAAKRILGMKISRDRKKKMLTLSQEEYIKKVLERNSATLCANALLGTILHPPLDPYFGHKLLRRKLSQDPTNFRV
ncbi:hypothetical protein L7F22_065123 [Adiantum nelumboides]|nr:hypothetical protein [Adiantum nelumboides]